MPPRRAAHGLGPAGGAAAPPRAARWRAVLAAWRRREVGVHPAATLPVRAVRDRHLYDGAGGAHRDERRRPWACAAAPGSACVEAPRRAPPTRSRPGAPARRKPHDGGHGPPPSPIPPSSECEYATTAAFRDGSIGGGGVRAAVICALLSRRAAAAARGGGVDGDRYHFSPRELRELVGEGTRLVAPSAQGA